MTAKKGRRFVLLMIQIGILLISASVIDFFYSKNIAPDKEAAERYKRTECLIINKKLSEKGHVIRRYRSDFLISYSINGVQYNRWVSGNGLDLSYSQNQRSQVVLLGQFVVGKQYPCWYDPESPQMAVLMLRHNWQSTFPLIIPAIVVVLTIYYFLKNLLSLTGIARQKSRKKKK
ncbi:MAG: hypothetical protein ACD_46C00628G0003 [uncultured bacterium]|nr:MAG: hypothetical protein ACD_46C00628G0003 [uncultured bacterium]